VSGNHMASWINGIQVSDWTDMRPADENPRNGSRLKAGTISIQGHDKTTDLSFRKLRIAETPPR
ncbi:MAG TPA: family 16 glycoside hydrolase, partial [Pirellulales bacterium]|nr:family 16 glycoside hydrolase [Pirellulales bacterium]